MKKLYQFFILTILVMSMGTMVSAYDIGERFEDAARDGHFDDVKQLLEREELQTFIKKQSYDNAKRKNPISSTAFALFCAAMNNHEEIVGLLLTNKFTTRYISMDDLRTLRKAAYPWHGVVKLVDQEIKLREKALVLSLVKSRKPATTSQRG